MQSRLVSYFCPIDLRSSVQNPWKNNTAADTPGVELNIDIRELEGTMEEQFSSCGGCSCTSLRIPRNNQFPNVL